MPASDRHTVTNNIHGGKGGAGGRGGTTGGAGGAGKGPTVIQEISGANITVTNNLADTSLQAGLHALLPHTVKAAFEAEERECCWDTTRTSVLAEISQWVNIKGFCLARQEQASRKNLTQTEPCIFWMNGSAGTGKTTIAATVAHGCATQEILGASFFCSRDDAECSDLRLIFPTIAYQLARFDAGFAARVFLVLKDNPDIAYTFPEHQLRQLIVEPLRLVRNSLPPCVIVLDALDECKDSKPVSMILAALSNHVTNLGPLRFFVTSRPEPHITMAISSEELGLHSYTQQFHLHELELPVVQQDIESYLLAKLMKTGRANSLAGWPARGDVHALAKLASGLFIFASTAAKFIEMVDYEPQAQLRRLLSNKDVNEAQSPSERLDRLYTQVLHGALPHIPERILPGLRRLIGSIVFLRDPLPTFALGKLLSLNVDEVRRTLVRLQSVILLPSNDSKAIRILHPSFFDFLCNPTRCLVPELQVQIEEQNSILAAYCLQALLEGLHRNMCRFSDSSQLNCEQANLPTQIATYIPPHVQYACRYWVYHILNAKQSDTLLALLDQFLLHHLLHWIEVCSLLGILRNALLSVAQLNRALLHSGQASPTMTNLLGDCEGFMRTFFDLISVSALQVYHSALLFSPPSTTLYSNYGREMDLAVEVHNAATSQWKPSLRMEVGRVLGIAFSSDGTQITSGSSSNIIIWDAVTGTDIQTLDLRHRCESPVNCVAFFPDGTQMVSGCVDGNIHIWDTVFGTKMNTLKAHLNIKSVVVSPDGAHILYGSADGALEIWDAINGAKVKTFAVENRWVSHHLVAFSPNGAHIVSVAYRPGAFSDPSIHIWNVVTGAKIQTLRPCGPVYCLAYFPDSTRIVSGSNDAVHIWDVDSGTNLNELRGHSGSILSVAVSFPDATHIVSGSSDKTIRIWDAANGIVFRVLRGHSERINYVAFSPDCTHIVSASDDHTVRIWDVFASTVSQTKDGYWDVNFLMLSLDSHRIVQGRGLRIWNAITGNNGGRKSGAHSYWGHRMWSALRGNMLLGLNRNPTARTLVTKHHSGAVTSVTFCPNGALIASVCHNMIFIWDAPNGTQLKELRNSRGVEALAFSLDSTRILSCLSSGSIVIWNIATGKALLTLNGVQTDKVQSLAFSRNGTRIVVESERPSEGSLLPDGHPHYVKRSKAKPSWKIDLWDAVTGVHLDTMNGDPGNVPSLAAHLKPGQTSFLLHMPHGISDPTDTPHWKRSEHSKVPHNLVVDGEWIYCSTHIKRLCWIPAEFAPNCLSVSPDNYHIVFGTKHGQVIIFDFTGIDSYCM